MNFIKQTLYVLLWFIHNKSGGYKPRSNLPKHEIEAIVRTFYPSAVAFFESEDGVRQFEEWKMKQEKEKLTKNTKKI